MRRSLSALCHANPPRVPVPLSEILLNSARRRLHTVALHPRLGVQRRTGHLGSTLLRAVLDPLPVPFPLLSPVEGATAHGAGLGGKGWSTHASILSRASRSNGKGCRRDPARRTGPGSRDEGADQYRGLWGARTLRDRGLVSSDRRPLISFQPLRAERVSVTASMRRSHSGDQRRARRGVRLARCVDNERWSLKKGEACFAGAARSVDRIPRGDPGEHQSDGRNTHSAGRPQLQCTARPRRPSPAAPRYTADLAAPWQPRMCRRLGPSVRLCTLGIG